jgi:TPR repeat protein
MTLDLLHFEEYRHYLAKEFLFAGKKIQGYGDPSDAFIHFKAAAIMGSPEAMCLCGRALASGDGCGKDEQEALFWLEEAAKRGFAEAEEPRDALRARGITPKDPEHLPSDHEIDEKDVAKVMQAELAESAPKEPEPQPKPQPKPEPKQQTEAERERIRQQQEEETKKRKEEYLREEGERKRRERQEAERAAALAKINRNPTSPEEQYQLAVRYATGDVVDRDPWLATEWYEKAAEQGHKKAQFDLALRYQYGDGAIRSTEMALKWYNRAALNGDRYAEHALGELLEVLDHSSSSSAPNRSAVSSKQLRKSSFGVLLFLAAAAVAFFAWRRIDVLYIKHLGIPSLKCIGLCAGYALLMLIGSLMLYWPRSLFLSLILPALGTAVFYFRLFPPAPVAIAGLYLLLAIARTLKGRRSLYGSSSNQRALIAEYRRTHKD